MIENTYFFRNKKKLHYIQNDMLALMHPRYFSHSHIITADTDSQGSCFCSALMFVHSAGEGSPNQTHTYLANLFSQMNVTVAGQRPHVSNCGLLFSASEPKLHLLQFRCSVSRLRLEPRFLFPAGGTRSLWLLFYLLVQPSDYVPANSCNTIMYYYVFRFVNAHFIVAIIDYCCMDEKKIWIK